MSAACMLLKAFSPLQAAKRAMRRLSRAAGAKPALSAAKARHRLRKGILAVGETVIKEGDYITLDGGTGNVYKGQLKLVKPEPPKAYTTLMSWVDKIRTLKVRTNADTPYDAEKARQLGAEGIGLCRTEHMFFDSEERILAIREMIIADDLESRKKALAKLLPFQTKDFEGIFKAMDGLPVTIRLIDPRSMSSCRTMKRTARPCKSSRRFLRKSRSACRAASRSQPHARPPWLPSGHHLS